MAYAALISLNQVIDLILSFERRSISVGQRKKITSLRQHVNFSISFFEKFPEKANRFDEKIRDLTNEAQDLIENFMWCRCRLGRSMFWLLKTFGVFIDEWQLKRVRDKFRSTVGDMMDDRLSHLPAVASSRVAATAKNDVVIGLDEDLIALKGRLCGESPGLQIIPIVGMGGIGKTTLARYAYDDPLILEYFDIRVFVQVSQHHSAKDFLTNLLASMELCKEQMLGEPNGSGIVDTEEKVYKRLKGRRYLIVMDDIWSTAALDEVRNIFPDDKNGSRIMLTTRDLNIAAYASGGSLHEMRFMDENHSWNLLKQRVFGNDQDCPPELEDTGKVIAQGCGGLPLGVVLVAGILSNIDKTRASWEEIAKDVNSVVDGQLDEILSLSYMHLPHHLRPCFLFMAAFPRDHIVRVSRLTKLWEAEGFLKGQNSEEEAQMYLKDLVKRSLVLATTSTSTREIKRCRLHDLVRRMCIKKAREEKFLLTDRHGTFKAREHDRRFSIHPLLPHHCGCIMKSRENSNTILCFRKANQSLLDYLASHILLQVLDVTPCRNNVLVPPQVFKLIHLKHLALPFTFDIPAAISNLLNLKTLIIGQRKKLSDLSFSSNLPQEIWKMPQLRHLIFYDGLKLPDPADGPTSLENLQTLLWVESFSCSKRILRMFPNLKRLGLFYYEKDKAGGHFHNLEDLYQLEKLKISAVGRINPVFPSSIKKLRLDGEGLLRWQDMSIVGSLPNLQVLKLLCDVCDGDTWETSEGEFLQLQYLRIGGSVLEHWITEHHHFPRLKTLVLHHCPLLNLIPESFEEMSSLERIKVDSLNESLVSSCKQIRRVQRQYGNDAFILQFLGD